jgi:ankyrin repeat protein
MKRVASKIYDDTGKEIPLKRSRLHCCAHMENACCFGHVRCVKYFLGCGVDVDDALEFDETTPLMHASMYGYDRIVKILVEAKANENAVDTMGRTALDIACLHSKASIVKLLAKNSGLINRWTQRHPHTPLMTAAITGCPSTLSELIRAGATINEPGVWGLTALMCATQNGNVGCAKLLIDAGADVDAKTTIGVTALMMASGGGWPECVKLLLGKRADINTKQKHTWMTALMLSCERDLYPCTKLLLDGGAGYTCVNRDGHTALDIARHHGSTRCTEALVAALDSEADEKTPVDRVCVVCMVNVVKVALDPCGHVCLCHMCCEQVKEKFGKCPKCRVEIKSSLTIHMG